MPDEMESEDKSTLGSAMHGLSICAAIKNSDWKPPDIPWLNNWSFPKLFESVCTELDRYLDIQEPTVVYTTTLPDPCIPYWSDTRVSGSTTISQSTSLLTQT